MAIIQFVLLLLLNGSSDMSMSSKKKTAKARIISDIRHEISTYTAAIAGGSKFKDYYQSKLLKLEEKLKTVL
jgi:hypothetical protein